MNKVSGHETPQTLEKNTRRVIKSVRRRINSLSVPKKGDKNQTTERKQPLKTGVFEKLYIIDSSGPDMNGGCEFLYCVWIVWSEMDKFW